MKTIVKSFFLALSLFQLAWAAGSSQEPLKIAFAYVGPVGDGGWSYSHDVGRRELQARFGEQISVTFIENVPEATEGEAVFRKLVSDGNKLIFCTTFGFMEPMLKVAAANTDVKFEHATGYKQTKNVRTYDIRTYEGIYLAGMVAGRVTKSNILGVVASIPIPEVIRNINSFTLGAQSVNPRIKTKVVWVNEWFNPPAEAEATNTLINNGADVLIQNTDSPAVLQTAQTRGKRAFGLDSDMTAYGPKAHLGSVVNNWGPYYVRTTKEVLEGTWQGGMTSWWGVKEGAVDLVSLAPDVPNEVKSRVNGVKKRLSEGSFAIWTGPIMDNTGNVRLPEDLVANDRFLAGMNFFVKGVEGKVPGTQN
jgi:simple sugar transport system substrate-binding protein